MVTWQINRRWAFFEKKQSSLWIEGSRYLLAMSIGGVVNYSVYTAIIIAFHQVAVSFVPLFAVAAGCLAGLIVNFVMAKKFVFAG
jgi:putative flippase GtrA